MKKRTYTIDEQYYLGRKLAEIFGLKQDAAGHYQLGEGYAWKTDVGVFNTVLALAEKINNGEKI